MLDKKYDSNKLNYLVKIKNELKENNAYDTTTTSLCGRSSKTKIYE